MRTGRGEVALVEGHPGRGGRQHPGVAPRGKTQVEPALILALDRDAHAAVGLVLDAHAREEHGHLTTDDDDDGGENVAACALRVNEDDEVVMWVPGVGSGTALGSRRGGGGRGCRRVPRSAPTPHLGLPASPLRYRTLVGVRRRRSLLPFPLPQDFHKD